MSQQVNTKYSRLLQNPRVEPIYLVQFDGVPTRFSTAFIKNTLGTTKSLLNSLQGAGSQITVDEGRSSLGQVTFSILDKDQVFTYLAFQYQMANRMVQVFGGFADLQEDEFVLLFTGRILDYTLAQDNVTWNLQAVNLLQDQKTDLFNSFSKLTADVSDVDVTLPVASTDKFAAATGGLLYLRIEDEVISYTGVTGTDFTGCTRGLMGTMPAPHASGTEVRNLVFLQGNPLTLALQILTSTGDGSNGSYDVLPACAGLAIPVQFIDVERFEHQRDVWVNSITFTFRESAKVTGKSFLEEQIYSFTNSYPVIDNEGRISVKVYAPPMPNQLAASLDDDVMLGAPTFQGSVLAQYFFNEVDISYDYDFITGLYASRALFENSDSQTIFNQTKTRTFATRGMHIGTLPNELPEAKLNSFCTRFLKRFATPSPILKAEAFFSRRLLEAGDIVPLTTAYLPNLATGKMGVQSQLMEIVQVDPDFLNACQSYMLLNTGYTYGRKYAAISPSSQPPIDFPVFSAATASQRNYAFVSREIDATHGVMGDGSDGYYITP